MLLLIPMCESISDKLKDLFFYFLLKLFISIHCFESYALFFFKNEDMWYRMGPS